MTEKRVVLSASRIKLFKTCSWSYYCRYILKLPDKGNDGTKRGNIIHLVLECLLKKRHRKHFDLLVTHKSAFASPAVHKLILKHAQKKGINDKENLELMSDMILVALNLDFYCAGARFLAPEEAFSLEADKYSITGFIDKIAVFDNSLINVYDYKTNKQKFNKEDMDGNLQALMYSLICFKNRGNIPQVKFLFLRFPKSPELNVEKCTEEELAGFENYLVYLTDYLSNFNLGKATCNYAANSSETKWLCGFAREKGQLTKNGKLIFSCPYKFPFNYYALVDRITGEPFKTNENPNELQESETMKISYRRYLGCPAYGYKITKKIQTLPQI